MINLYNEDCLTGMSRIPDGSVDFVLTDPPFGSTDAPWDKRLPLEPFWAQILRVTKLNAAIVLFSRFKASANSSATNGFGANRRVRDF